MIHHLFGLLSREKIPGEIRGQTPPPSSRLDDLFLVISLDRSLHRARYSQTSPSHFAPNLDRPGEHAMDQFLDLEEDFDLDPLDMQAHQYDFFPDLLQQEAAHPPPPPPLPEMEQPQPPPPEMVDAIPDSVKSDCRINVLSLFPDIDPDHLTLLCEEGLWQSDGIIEQILNQQEEGKQYPKAPKPNLKRKRDDEENPILQWDNLERRSQQRPLGYLKTRSVPTKTPAHF